MMRVRIGVHVYEEPRRLHATLASLERNMARGVELLLLADGPDDATRDALGSLSDIEQSCTEMPRGAPACFNRLVASTNADVYVFIESGARVGRDWLDHLLAALRADERNGLAGPSTNRCWNEQEVGGRCSNSIREIDEAAQACARRFGPAARTLEPLYSLADFCYAVRREVVEAIGDADELYGLGPCWEMDYNVRAARAGWRGVWACAAYVERAPPTARRRREEALRFTAAKRRYQDKFCGARLRGEKRDYREHCRGDECPNFAPPALIALRHPPPRPALPTALHPAVETATAAPVAHESPSTATPPSSVSSCAPLVSCIMPTADRRAYVPQAIRYFQRQDYPNLELLVVDDGTDAVADCLPEDPRVRYIRLPEKLTIGAKRNFACEQTRGEFIVHWDDDDWYPPWRVGAQLRAMGAGDFELCGTSQLFYFEPATTRAWRYKYSRPGKSWVAGSTLAYRKSFWAQRKFPGVQVGEDTRFVMSAPAVKVCDLDDPRLCAATVHPANTSRKVTAGAFWHPETSATVHALLGDDLDFYRALGTTTAYRSGPPPLVSCIMPTANRRPFVALALEHFARQDYPYKELIVVDDGADPVGDLVEDVPGTTYMRLARRASIGVKRNLACARARGQIIAHWDDDDWYAPNRLSYQAGPILAGEADLTGLVNSFVMVLPGGEFWTTLAPLHTRMFTGDVHGGTLVYRKSLFDEGLRYPASNLAEDAALIRQAVRRGKRLLRLDNAGAFVYVRHGRNAWREFAPGRFLDPAGWKRTGPPRTFPTDALRTYQSAAAAL